MLRAADASSDSVRWKLESGGTVGPQEVALASIPAAGLRVCIYDGAAAAPPLVAMGVGEDCGGKPCWRAIGPKGRAAGLRYRNKTGAPDGIVDVRLRARNGELGLVLRAQRGAVAMPALGVRLPMTAQLLVGDPAHPLCWQSTFATAFRNDGTVVKATQQP